MRNRFINFLYFVLGKLQSKRNENEHKLRIASVRDFLHETLPSLDSEWAGKAVLEGPIKANYFVLPNNQFPEYTFIIPQVPLFILVPGITSATWDEARLRGITRAKWEEDQMLYSCIVDKTSQMSSGSERLTHIIYLPWNASVNHLALMERIKDII